VTNIKYTFDLRVEAGMFQRVFKENSGKRI
jgi:hypothetical protein